MSDMPRIGARRTSPRRSTPGLPRIGLAIVLAASPAVATIPPWVELGREPACTVALDPQSVRAIDPGVFEMRLLFEGVCSTGNPSLSRFSMYTGTRMEVVHIRCADRSYRIMETWDLAPQIGIGETETDRIGGWRRRRAIDQHYPPGWRFDIPPATGYAAALAHTCGTSVPER
jgi:hypothetical protein